jgi:hypothetical protein
VRTKEHRPGLSSGRELKAIGSDESFEAIYPGDTAYRAFRNANGGVHILELPSRAAVFVAPDEAAELNEALRDVDSSWGYGDNEINAVQHWLLARAFARIHPPRKTVPALGNEWPRVAA